MLPSTDDTIVAISSPPGRGGIGVVRLSGPDAVLIAMSLFRSAETGDAVAGPPPPRQAIYGTFLNSAGETIDRGYLIVFAPPRSFTGEETAELWAHGSPPVLRALVEQAVLRGARAATPGEFSLRALLNGRIDATQAEAIRDLIEARTLYQARVAAEQAGGRIARAVNDFKDRVSDALARIEAAVEFSEEPEAGRFLPEGRIVSEIRAVRTGLEALAQTFERGRRVREGVTAALAGLPNVGKSSLFNRLLEEDRAIVTPIAGTTRDLIEESLDLRGVPTTLVDTAGLEDGADAAGAEAVRRARGALERADVVLLVLDWSRPMRDEERALLSGLPAARALVVLNKVDLACGIGLDRVLYLRKRHDVLEISAKNGEGIADLRRRMEERVAPGGALDPDSQFLTSVRQRDLLARAAASLARAEHGALEQLGGEYLALDLRDALDALGEVTGEVGLEAIYDRLFSTFCIGK